MTRHWATLIALSAALGCGAKKPPREPAGVNAERPLLSSSAAVKRDAVPRPLPSYLVATMTEKSIGPFVARRGDVVMAAYLGASSGVRRVVSIPMTAEGDVRGDAHVLAPANSEATALVVRPTGGSGAGFVAAWTSLTDRGETLTLVGIDDAGLPRGAATELARTMDHIVWMDVVATPKGAICVWAEETRTGDANVLAVALDPDGTMRGVPARIARGISGWQVTAAGQGVGLALVTTTEASAANANASTSRVSGASQKRRASQKAGALSWLRLDADAHPVGAPIVVASKPTVSGDVEVAHLRDRYVFAWTDRTGNEPEVTIARVSEDGSAEPPKKVLASVGGSALVGLTTGPAGGLLVWDAPNRRGRPSRHVQFAHLDLRGELDGRSSAIDIAGRVAPEIAATDTGFAFLGSVRAGDADAVPTFVRFDASLAPIQTEPFVLGEDRAPVQVAWGLSCMGDRCAALTATGDPAQVRSIDIVPRASSAPRSVSPPLSADAPRIGVIATLAQGEPFADVSVAKVDGATLVATLGTTLDAASLQVRAFDDNGAPLGKPSFLSSRALAIGSVSMATGGTPEDGAAIAWVARDSGDPQVHVTRVDSRGKRQNDIMLTSAKGNAADVAIAWAGGGWIVAWVDWRSGNGEVYATKLDPALRRIAREERITNAPGDASGVTLLPRGDLVWLAYADPRESPNDGLADVFVTQLHARDAKPAGAERRLLASAAHSRSPALAATTDGIVVGWIEEAPLGADAATSVAYGAMLARLDEQGKPRGALMKMRPAGDGFPTAIALEGTLVGVRGVVARADKEELDVDAFELSPADVAPHTFPLLTLDGPPSLDASLRLSDGTVFYNDDGAEPGDRRVRRATVVWKR